MTQVQEETVVVGPGMVVVHSQAEGGNLVVAEVGYRCGS